MKDSQQRDKIRRPIKDYSRETTGEYINGFNNSGIYLIIN
jgi:hypothetical protein